MLENGKMLAIFSIKQGRNGSIWVRAGWAEVNRDGSRTCTSTCCHWMDGCTSGNRSNGPPLRRFRTEGPGPLLDSSRGEGWVSVSAPREEAVVGLPRVVARLTLASWRVAPVTRSLSFVKVSAPGPGRL